MVQRKDGKITRIVLERKSDVDLIKGMDGKLDILVTGHAVVCKQVEINTGVIKEHGKRLTWVERILWTIIGGGFVIVGILKSPEIIKWLVK